MKLSCKVIEDMLPMYYDGVCSDESATLVEEHLKECPQCSRVLADLHAGVNIPENPVNDLKPLEGIQAEWKKEKRRSAKKGACVTLVVIAALLIISTIVWYFGYAIHYDKLAEKLEKVKDETAAMTTASHCLEYGDYMIVLKKPGFLGEGGFIHIGDKEGMVIFLDEEWNEIGQNQDMCIDLFFYPEFGGRYRSAIIFDDGDKSWWVWLTPELTYNYDLYDSANRPPEEIAHLEQLLVDYHEEVAALIDVAKEVWGIDLRK